MVKRFFLKINLLDLLGVGALFFTLPFFFYKLGQSSLVSWDEAWYAEIARNILKSGNLMELVWNKMPYTDHPPAGFWLIALGIKFLGENEFGVRAASAIAGFLTIIFVYFLGKELFNRVVGFSSAIALTSAFWFLFRARSGNLDVFLTMFFVLTLLLALKVKKNVKFVFPFFLSLALLFLTKTIVPFTIIPPLILIFWDYRIAKENRRTFFLGIGLFLTVFGSWFLMQFFYREDFLSRFFMIGLPGVGVKTSYFDNLILSKEYLHDGIGRWFWPGILSIFLSIFLFQKRFYILSIFFLTFYIPFIFSSKGHIWHLVPLYPILILAFFGTAFVLGEKILNLRFVQKIFTKILNSVSLSKKFSSVIVVLVILVGCFYLSFIQLRQVWYSFIDIPRYISDEEILSKEAGKYPYKFYIDGDFGPSAVWYSKKKVQKISNDEIVNLFANKSTMLDDESFLLITRQYRLGDIKSDKNSYKILKMDRDKVLILKEE